MKYLVAFIGLCGIAAGVYLLRRPSLPSTDSPQALLLDLMFVVLFGLQHSGMARRAFKRLLPPLLERNVYLLATAIVLLLLFIKWEPLPDSVWFTTVRWPFQCRDSAHHCSQFDGQCCAK